MRKTGGAGSGRPSSQPSLSGEQMAHRMRYDGDVIERLDRIECLLNQVIAALAVEGWLSGQERGVRSQETEVRSHGCQEDGMARIRDLYLLIPNSRLLSPNF